ncbi:MAG TPA: polysaccharide deacetylase family protein [Actinomycetota bacterium]
MSDGLRVALTFDAEHPDRPLCPGGNVDRVLDALHAAAARATFFVQARWATAHPEAAARIAREGHLVGHHSKFHARMTLLSDDGLRADVREGEEEIRATTGADPRPWFRCPFGDGHDDERVLSTLGGLGYRNVFWHVVLEDWEPWRSPDDLRADAVAGAIAHGDGAVVLLHTWPAPTAEALAGMLEDLAAAGARFVGVDELEPELLP